ncbi:M20/M25/M40 family metallo-hydrolase [Amycolatopsis thermalba]|uniref:M20/M25/M40 family metallo-hydrolase n=1 Tax=Amycolatopsis thermalba TaxID=944492 RepID=UPI001F07AA9A|nr:M20/M25/M40 family metallo-hydrolase [Amycolatopsis thermalba]
MTAAPSTAPVLTARDTELLLTLLRLPTVSPLEAPGEQPMLWEAQRVYAAVARESGFRVLHHGSADPAVLRRDDVPRAVRGRPAEFLATQPNLVLRLGPALPRSATVMFNVHFDTVAGAPPVTFDGHRVTGRGAVDAKGQAVAVLAGIRARRAADPRIGRDVAVLVQAVSGEEGGALGCFGTRPLVEAGYVGRLNVFCEPTGSRYLCRATASMTAELRVAGLDTIDDRPGAGHNATVLLGFLAQHLAGAVAGEPGAAVCVAGLHTGDQHNRVYGTGRLLLNIGYPSVHTGRRLEGAVERAVRGGLAEFRSRFAALPALARTAVASSAITTLVWHKRRLPCLAQDETAVAALCRAAGLAPWPAADPAFTCDAIWMDGVPGAATVVLGAGSLDANHAHADGEYAELADLAGFAGAVARLLTCFADEETTP